MEETCQGVITIFLSLQGRIWRVRWYKMARAIKEARMCQSQPIAAEMPTIKAPPSKNLASKNLEMDCCEGKGQKGGN